MKLGPVQGPLSIDEYERVCKFTRAVEQDLDLFLLGQQVTTTAEIRYAKDLPEYPLLAIQFNWQGFVRLEHWKSLRELESLDSEHNLTYETSVLTFVKRVLSDIATRKI